MKTSAKLRIVRADVGPERVGTGDYPGIQAYMTSLTTGGRV